jgi:uncharacterized protein (TIGR02285 family)
MIYKSKPDLVYTSIPNLLYYPHGIVIHKDALSKLTQDHKQPISFDKLLQNSGLKGGIPQGRTFGDILQPIWDKHKNQSHIYVRQASDSTQGIFQMIKIRRLDYTVEYIYTMRYWSKELNIENDLVFLTLIENKDTFVLGAIAVTKNEWGKQAIKEINRAIIETRNTPQYKKMIS